MKLAVILSALFLTACQHRPATPQIDARIIIPMSCLTKEIVIDHCDPSTEPPKCKGPTRVNYKAGCEQVQVKPKEPVK